MRQLPGDGTLVPEYDDLYGESHKALMLEAGVDPQSQVYSEMVFAVTDVHRASENVKSTAKQIVRQLTDIAERVDKYGAYAHVSPSGELGSRGSGFDAECAILDERKGRLTRALHWFEAEHPGLLIAWADSLRGKPRSLHGGPVDNAEYRAEVAARLDALEEERTADALIR